MKMFATALTRVELQTDDGRYVTSMEFDANGIHGTSNRWYIELGSGERVEITPLQLFQKVFEIGHAHGMKGKPE